MGAGQTKKDTQLLVEGRLSRCLGSPASKARLLAAGDRMERKERIKGLLPRAVSEAEQEVLG